MNVPTFTIQGTDALARVGETGNLNFSDVDGTGGYNEYLGCNRCGSNAPGIGIQVGALQYLAGEDELPEKWTVEDQDEAARTPQVSAVISNRGRVNRSTVPYDSSGGQEGKADQPILHADIAGLDFNDTANFLAATQAAAPDAVVDAGTGAVNKTGAAVAIGDTGWFPVPVA